MSALPPKADIGTQSWNVRFDIGPGSLIHHNLDTCIAIKQLFELEARKLISGLFADMRGKAPLNASHDQPETRRHRARLCRPRSGRPESVLAFRQRGRAIRGECVSPASDRNRWSSTSRDE
jgi:hypothetical protein